jgi:hypothetical protein
VFYVADIRSRLRTLGWRWDELKAHWNVDQSEDLERYSGMTDTDNTPESARVARVGWVEAIAETHHNPHRRMMGFALLYPSYSGYSGNGRKWMEECGSSGNR